MNKRPFIKPGYYIDWTNDIMVVYPDGRMDVFIYMHNGNHYYEERNVEDWIGNFHVSDFLGDL